MVTSVRKNSLALWPRMALTMSASRRHSGVPASCQVHILGVQFDAVISPAICPGNNNQANDEQAVDTRVLIEHFGKVVHERYNQKGSPSAVVFKQDQNIPGPQVELKSNPTASKTVNQEANPLASLAEVEII